ncbi:MAG: AMP-binding protein, partial [Pseudoclavibacter sp.]
MNSTPTQALREARDRLVDVRTDYDAAIGQFAWPDVGATFNFAHDWFDAIARGNETPALIILEEDGSRRSYTFDELARRSDLVAVLLRDQGVGRGDPVVVMLGNQVELWESMLAIMKLGAVIMPTTTAVGPRLLAERVERGGATAIVFNEADAAKLVEIPDAVVRISVGGEERSGAEGAGAERTGTGSVPYARAYAIEGAEVEHPANGSDDTMLLYFTSGTTSSPKLVVHTHTTYPVGHLSTLYWIGLRPGDVHLNISSPGWGKHAWSSFFAPWLAEATVLVFNYARFDAPSLLQVLQNERVTSFCAPPTVWRMLIGADLAAFRPSGLRELIGAGEPLNPEVIHRVEEHWGMTIRDGYGQTESTASVANTPGQTVRPGSMGRPLPGVPVVLVDPATGEVVEGEGEGELCLDLASSPLTLMPGYLGDDERDAASRRGGVYHSGDLATRDADGYITYVGRDDDVFKASDYKISPFELESTLIEHPAVAEAAVVPAPDAVRLAVPKAYIALAAGHEPTSETARSILAYARDQLPPYLRLRRVEFFELPKTISGKIRRVELRQREESLAGSRIET